MTDTTTMEVASGSAGTTCPAEDAALCTRLLAGDEEAFTQLVRHYHASLMRLAIVFVADREVAEEVVQDTWVAVLTGLNTFEGRSALKTWIFSILTNRAKTRGVREKRSIPFSALASPTFGEEPAVDPSRFTAGGSWSEPPDRWDRNTPEQVMLRHEARVVMDHAIADLPSNQRAVVTLRDVEGLDAGEVCNVLGVTETNQRVLLHRGRSKVRAVLERYLARA